ncbi:unnamed protein product [Gongylonema pulchrum]|uniref:Helicase C-terminal domain-containing protein n=1 Tax=Gongylonema pulchrum TaxID=637853 RepID=A0A183D371_9BILA|nr:unnamed protein product [Gongylonema pulchrum]
MNMPVSLKQYVHRVGRTARAGRVGRSISLVGESERKILKEIVASNKGDVIEAYKKRIEGFEESIKRIEEEEKAERALRLANEELQRSELKLEGKDELRDRRLAEFQIRAAKRARKGKKIRAVVEHDERPSSGKKKRKAKSSFTAELTAVGKKDVKRFRHG